MSVPQNLSWVTSMAQQASDRMSPVAAYIGAFMGIRKEVNQRKFDQLLRANDPVQLDKLADSYEDAAVRALGRTSTSGSRGRSGSTSGTAGDFTTGQALSAVLTVKKQKLSQDDKVRLTERQARREFDKFKEAYDGKLAAMDNAARTYSGYIEQQARSAGGNNGPRNITAAVKKIQSENIKDHQKIAILQRLYKKIQQTSHGNKNELLAVINTLVGEQYGKADILSLYDEQKLSEREMRQKEKEIYADVADADANLPSAEILLREAKALAEQFGYEGGQPGVLDDDQETEGLNRQELYNYYMAKATETRQRADQARRMLPELLSQNPFQAVSQREETDRTPFMAEMAAEAARRPQQFRQTYEDIGLDPRMNALQRSFAIGQYEPDPDRATSAFVPYVGESFMDTPERYGESAESAGFVLEELESLMRKVAEQGDEQTEEKRQFINLYEIVKNSPKLDAGLRNQLSDLSIQIAYQMVDEKNKANIEKQLGEEKSQQLKDLVESPEAMRDEANSIADSLRSMRIIDGESKDFSFAEAVLSQIESIEDEAMNPSDIGSYRRLSEKTYDTPFDKLDPEEQQNIVNLHRQEQYLTLEKGIEDVSGLGSLVGSFDIQMSNYFDNLKQSAFDPQTSDVLLSNFTSGFMGSLGRIEDKAKQSAASTLQREERREQDIQSATGRLGDIQRQYMALIQDEGGLSGTGDTETFLQQESELSNQIRSTVENLKTLGVESTGLNVLLTDPKAHFEELQKMRQETEEAERAQREAEEAEERAQQIEREGRVSGFGRADSEPRSNIQDPIQLAALQEQAQAELDEAERSEQESLERGRQIEREGRVGRLQGEGLARSEQLAKIDPGISVQDAEDRVLMEAAQLNREPDIEPEPAEEILPEDQGLEDEIDLSDLELFEQDLNALQGIKSPFKQEAEEPVVGLPSAEERTPVFKIPGVGDQEFIMQVDFTVGSNPFLGKLARLYQRPIGSTDLKNFEPVSEKQQHSLYEQIYDNKEEIGTLWDDELF